ncbi:MAG: phosphoribosylglycinamide formyltransferase [Pseudomonadota bacterium]
MNAKTARVAVLISGRGSNMVALAQACLDPDYPAEIVTVISDTYGAGGLARADEQGIKNLVVARKDFSNKQAHEAALSRLLAACEPDVICLAGFMRILSAEFLAPWQGRIINIHPSLLPKHKGLDTHAKALAAGDTEHGCSVHHVTPGMDEGPVIAQARVPVLAGDTSDTLAARVIVEEHKLYPHALQMLIESLGV